jgi:hypothetical protein
VGSVEDLLREAAELCRAVGPRSDLRLIGGLAVRLYVGPSGRVTKDIDLVAMTGAVRAILTTELRTRGFQVGETGPWTRAMRSGPSRLIVDVSGHPVVDLRSFESASLSDDVRHFDVAGMPLAVACPDDVARLKLLAHRDHDLVDLVLLATAETISPDHIARMAEADDAERALARGAVGCRQALDDGSLASTVEELLARPCVEADLAPLQRLLSALKSRGI